MSQPPPFEPPRLRGLHPQDDPAGLSRLVRSAIQAPRDPVPRLKGRIRSTLRRKSAWRRRWVRAAIVGGIIFVAGAVVGAVMQPVLRFRRPTKVASVEHIYPSTPSVRARNRRAPASPASPLLQDLASEQSADLTPAPPASDSTSETEPSGKQAPPSAPKPVPAPISPADRAAVTARPPVAAPLSARPPVPDPPTARPPVPDPPTARPPVPDPPTAHPPSSSRASKHASSSTPASRSSATPTVQSSEVDTSVPPSFHQPLHPPARTAMLEPPSQYADPPGWPPRPSTIPAIAPVTPATYAFVPPRGLPTPERQPPTQPQPPTPAPNQPPPQPQPPAQPQPAAAKPQPASTPQPPATLAGEQALLFQAIRSLRSLRRPDQALGVLDEYLARFPNGSLLPEANRLRTEALLALGHTPAALAELNRGLGQKANGGDEHRLVRGELHARAGRWQQALEDFDAVVRVRLASGAAPGTSASAKSGDIFERALWGRASARSHVGDDLGARADLREYLRRFSDGRFARQARQLLGGLHRE